MEYKEDLISYRLEKAQESIDAAYLLLSNGMLTSSMNRVYYAMFYAVQALLVLDNVAFSKHGQVRGYFNREFIKSKKYPLNTEDYTLKRLSIAKNLIMSILPPRTSNSYRIQLTTRSLF
jgi:uncharacterized protein (UPF0332 family)